MLQARRQGSLCAAAATQAPYRHVSQHRHLWPFALIAVAALLIRAPDFGNLHVEFDETFYLLVGDHMLAGALPYVDIWDRKPIGLFLIYAAIRLLGGEGFVQYQLVAAIFAAATACILFLMAQRWTGRWGAIGVALLYLINMRLFHSSAGQSETFFNLFLAGSAWLALKAMEEQRASAIRRLALPTMLLCGLALQIKYMALPQCLFFGLAFLFLHWRATRSLPAVVREALFYAALGLAPTLLALAVYALIGEADAFIHANFLSIFGRGSLDEAITSYTATYVFFAALPLMLAASAALLLQRPDHEIPQQERIFLAAWLIFSAAGFFMVGNLYIHYFVPVLLPMVAAIALLLRSRVPGLPLFITLFAFATFSSGFPGVEEARARTRAVERLTAMVQPHLNGRCLYIYDGPSAVYVKTKSCLLTTYLYPDHLNNAMEQDALGIDTSAEVKRILAARPGAILFADRPVVPLWNPRTERLVRDAIRRDYLQTGSVMLDRRFIDVFVLKSPPSPSLEGAGRTTSSPTPDDGKIS